MEDKYFLFKKKFFLIYKNQKKKAFFSFLNSSFSNLEKENFLHPIEINEYKNFFYYKKKYNFLIGRFCIKNALKLKNKKIDFNKILIGKGIFNNPLIKIPKNLKINITLSHSENVSSSILFPIEYSIGIDIESIQPKIFEIIKDHLTNDEKEKILKNYQFSSQVLSTLYWTAKEALSKALLTGLTVPFKIYSIKENNYYYNYWISNFKYFYQYEVFSFIIKKKYMCSFVYPKETFKDFKIFNNLIE